MTPLQLYEQQLSTGKIKYNPDQYQVLLILDEIYQQLNKQQQKLDFWGNFYRQVKIKKPITGLYLWGKVGRGKTHLVNLFYQCLSIHKIRQHFHAFMQDIHHRLARHQGKKNPLKVIAKEFASHTRVLVLDEFFVTNIADAMILGELLAGLFQQGVCLITTSNIEPDQLYLNGLQREHFLPAIQLIKSNTHVIELSLDQDYRQTFLQSLSTYYSPLTIESSQSLAVCFNQFKLPNEPVITQQTISLFNRNIPIKQESKGILWCDFRDICSPPRSAKDYIALSQIYHTFIIDQVPQLSSVSVDQVILFIYLIDILYDENLRLIISAAVPLSELYNKGRLRQRFERTESRLLEMQSPEYFDKIRKL